VVRVIRVIRVISMGYLKGLLRLSQKVIRIDLGMPLMIITNTIISDNSHCLVLLLFVELTLRK